MSLFILMNFLKWHDLFGTPLIQMLNTGDFSYVQMNSLTTSNFTLSTTFVILIETTRRPQFHYLSSVEIIGSMTVLFCIL